MITAPEWTPLARAFFDRPVLEIAPDLLGRVLVRSTDDGPIELRLTEVEAYDGPTTPAHAYRGRTDRNAVMFGPPGSPTPTSCTACQVGQHERCGSRSSR